jgi:hypothetical protein
MTVQAPNGPPPVRETRAEAPPQEGRTPPSRGENPEHTPGGNRPDDFGHRNPDYDGDGRISEAESRTYSEDVRSEDRRYTTDSKERLAHEKEEGKNYRAEVSAATAQNASNNDNKMHKMFGKQSQPVPQPVRPDGPSPS